MKRIVFVCILLCASHAEAFWSDEITSHLWDTVVTPNQTDPITGANYSPAVTAYDCGPDGYGRGQPQPGRTAGGWSEHRFMNSQEQGFFQSLKSDWSRSCPKTFNEYTYSHSHGVMSGRLAAYKGVVFGVYDTSANYYGGTKIKLMRDPSSITSYPGGGPQRRYTVIDLARNPRQNIDVDPGSSGYDLAFAPLALGGSNIDCSGLSNPYNGTYHDRSYARHTGKDQEGTSCAPPSTLQTFDPDIDIREPQGAVTQPAAYVAWAERYVDGVSYAGYGGSLDQGFDPRYLLSAGTEPERPMAVHVQKLDPNTLLSSFDRRGSEFSPASTTPLSSGDRGLMIDSGGPVQSAVSPRIVALDNGAGVYQPVLAVAQVTLTKQFPGGTYAAQMMPSADLNRPLQVRIGHVLDAGWDTLSASLGNVCTPQTVSSGRATGRKPLFTGTHDIGVMKVGAVERPIVIATLQTAAGCELRAKRWNGGTSWVDLGADLRVSVGSPGGTPAFPRVTSLSGVPYIAWVETASSGNSFVYVKKYRADTGTWELIGGSAWALSTDMQRVGGPAIAVVPLKAVASSSDEGGTVYVSSPINEPLGWWNVLDGKEGVWQTSVSRCTVVRQSDGSFACTDTPRAYVTPKLIYPATGLQVYDPTYTLGVAAGQRTLGVASGASQVTGWVLDFKANQPGAADLISVGGSINGEPAKLYTSWTGPVQDHRDFDQGLFVKKDEPLPAGKRLLANGTNFTISYSGSGTQMLGQGVNTYGQLGSGTAATTSTAFVFPTPEAPAKLTANGNTAAAISATGKLYTWGFGGNAQLCNGSTSNATTPVLCDVPGGSSYWFTDVALGSVHLMALRSDGTVWTRGLGNSGVLGNYNGEYGTLSWVQVLERATPTSNIVAMQNVASVYAGANHNCVLKSDRKAWCWGRNDAGQLGLNDAINPMPYMAYGQPIANASPWLSLALGDHHNIGVWWNGISAAWGQNTHGQLGLGDTTLRRTATQTFTSSSLNSRAYASAHASYIQAGPTHVGQCASGHVGLWVTGRNNNGQQIWATGAAVGFSAYWNSVCVRGNFAQLFTGAGANYVSVSVHGDTLNGAPSATDRSQVQTRCLSTTCPSWRSDITLFDGEDWTSPNRPALNNTEPARWGNIGDRYTFGGSYPVFGSYGFMYTSLPVNATAGVSAVGRWNGPSDAVGVDPTGYCALDLDMYVATGSPSSVVTPQLRLIADDAWQGNWSWSLSGVFNQAIAPGSWVHLSLPISGATVYSVPKRIDFVGLSNPGPAAMTGYGAYWFDNVALKGCL